MLGKYSDIWSGHLEKLEATEHRIELKPGMKPAHHMPYKQGLPIRDKREEDARDQLDKGVIETSKWASPVVFLPKKDSSLQFFVDYRRMNEATVADTYPLP